VISIAIPAAGNTADITAFTFFQINKAILVMVPLFLFSGVSIYLT
jgi:hypothetical protein